MLVTRVEPMTAVLPVGTERVRALACDVEVTVSGGVDPTTGMVINLSSLKEIIRARVVDPLDGRVLDGSEGRPRCLDAESLTIAVWRMLAGEVPEGSLARVGIATGQDQRFHYRGGTEPAMDVTRVYEFCAAHRLHASSLSEEENVRVFGKCNNPAGHGHNYVLEVTLRGEPDATGKLLPAADFDRIVTDEIVERWDHKNLNVDVPEFRGIVPTVEEIARIAWHRLARPLAEAAGPGRELFRVKLFETPRNRVEYYGE
jgi:6-pyruvoyltetrahydropterin/6-carboxytetrahydropterin synthase